MVNKYYVTRREWTGEKTVVGKDGKLLYDKDAINTRISAVRITKMESSEDLFQRAARIARNPDVEIGRRAMLRVFADIRHVNQEIQDQLMQVYDGDKSGKYWHNWLYSPLEFQEFIDLLSVHLIIDRVGPKFEENIVAHLPDEIGPAITYCLRKHDKLVSAGGRGQLILVKTDTPPMEFVWPTEAALEIFRKIPNHVPSRLAKHLALCPPEPTEENSPGNSAPVDQALSSKRKQQSKNKTGPKGGLTQKIAVQMLADLIAGKLKATPEGYPCKKQEELQRDYGVGSRDTVMKAWSIATSRFVEVSNSDK